MSWGSSQIQHKTGSSQESDQDYLIPRTSGWSKTKKRKQIAPMPNMHHLVKKLQKLNSSIISQQSAHNICLEVGYMIKPLQRMYSLCCDVASTQAYKIPSYPMWGIKSDTTNLLLSLNDVCDACGLKERQIQYTIWHTLITSDPISSVRLEISNLQRLITITWLFIWFSLRSFAAAHSCTRWKCKFNSSIHL
jgi:hypothetical protein